MNNELTIISQNGQLVMDSREVAEMIGKEHKNLLADIRTYVEYMSKNGVLKIQPSDFFIESTYINSQNKEQPCFEITKKGCELIANKMTGEKGVIFTAMYVTKFEEMENKLRQPLQIDSKFLFQIAAQLEEKERQISLMAPKAKFFDAVAESKDAIAIGDAAKVLNMGIGRNKLFQLLRKKKILMNNNIPYQEYIDRGYFRTVEQKWTTAEGETKINIKTLVYQKGLDYIRKVVSGNNEIALTA